MPSREVHERSAPIRIPSPRPRRSRSLLRPIGLEEEVVGLSYIEPPDDLTEDTPPTAIPSSFLITLAGGEDDLDADEGSLDDAPTTEQAGARRPAPHFPVPAQREWVEVAVEVPVIGSPPPRLRPAVTTLVAAVLVGAGLALLLVTGLSG